MIILTPVSGTFGIKYCTVLEIHAVKTIPTGLLILMFRYNLADVLQYPVALWNNVFGEQAKFFIRNQLNVKAFICQLLLFRRRLLQHPGGHS